MWKKIAEQQYGSEAWFQERTDGGPSSLDEKQDVLEASGEEHFYRGRPRGS